MSPSDDRQKQQVAGQEAEGEDCSGVRKVDHLRPPEGRLAAHDVAPRRRGRGVAGSAIALLARSVMMLESER